MTSFCTRVCASLWAVVGVVQLCFCVADHKPDMTLVEQRAFHFGIMALQQWSASMDSEYVHGKSSRAQNMQGSVAHVAEGQTMNISQHSPAAEDLVSLLSSSLQQAIHDEEELVHENSALEQEIRQWVATNKQDVKRKAVRIFTSEHVDKPSGLTLFSRVKTVSTRAMSTIRNAVASMSAKTQACWVGMLQQLMLVRFTSIGLVVTLVLAAWFLRREGVGLKFSGWYDKMGAIRQIFGGTKAPCKVEVAEIHIGGLPSGGRRLTISVGSSRRETEALNDQESAFLRFSETFVFSVCESDSRCIFSVIDTNLNTEMASMEMKGSELIALARRPQDYHRTELSLRKELAKAMGKANRTKPYLAMRVRNVTHITTSDA